MLRPITQILCATAFLWGAVNWWMERPIPRSPGVLAPEEPVQSAITPLELPAIGQYQLQAVATYTIKARILSTERYWLADGSDLAPIDVAVGWGRMSDEAVLRQLHISQDNRFFFYRWDNQPPIPRREIESHAANMHVISANAEIARAVRKLRRGEVVTLQGYLVNVTSPTGGNWRTSLYRTDTGAGACEVFYVQSCNVSDPPKIAAR